MSFQTSASHLRSDIFASITSRPGRMLALVLPLLVSIFLMLPASKRTTPVARQSIGLTETSDTTIAAKKIATTTQAGIREAYGKLPLSFEANEGQAAPRVKFVARGSGYGLSLTQTGATLTLNKKATRQTSRDSVDEREMMGLASRTRQPAPAVLRLQLKGADPDPRVMGTDELAGKVNYLTGADSKRWRTNIQTYARVRYEQVYKDIDLVYYGNQGQLEYDFEIAPGGNPDDIRLAFEGMQRLALDEKGDLLLKMKDGDVRWHKPVVYQEVNGARREIAGRYVIENRGREVRFKVGAYDANRPLVIDPTLVYSTYFGGYLTEEGNSIAFDSSGSAYITGSANNFSSGFYDDTFVTKLNAVGTAIIYSTYLGGNDEDIGYGIGVDASGNAHVTGQTCSDDFPVLNAYQPTRANSCDAFIMKLDASGSGLLFSTYLGGMNRDVSGSIALDPAGNAYITGYTYSYNFPTLNAAQSSKSGRPTFKSTDGGNSWNEAAQGLTASFINALLLDPANPGTVYAGTDLGVYKSTNGGSTWSSSNNGILNHDDIRAMVFDPTNSSTLYAASFLSDCVYKSTDAGNNWTSSCGDGNYNLSIAPMYALAIDPTNPATLYAGGGSLDYISKSTNGGKTWQAINTGIQPTPIRALAVDPTTAATIYAGGASGIIYKTTDGGGHWVSKKSTTFVLALAIDPANASTVYAATTQGVLKSTNAGDTWTSVNNGLSVTYGAATFIPSVYSLAISKTAPQIIYAGTRYGGVFKSTDGGANWSQANPGLTNNFITALAVNPATPSIVYAGSNSGADAFVAKFNPAGSLLYSTYVGGNESEIGNGIAVDASGNAYIAGMTSSLNFPTLNPFQSSIKDTSDAFIAKLNSGGSAFSYSTYLGGDGNDQAWAIAVDSAGSAYVTGQTLSPNFPTTAGAFDTTCGPGGGCAGTPSSSSTFTDAFVTKLTPAGSALAYSTFLGGSSTDIGYAIALTSDRRAYVAGSSTSPDFPTVNPYQASRSSGQDVFVSRLNSAGSALDYSTYLGGPSDDNAYGIAVDAAGSAYVTGTTKGTFPTVTPLQSNPGGGFSDAFILKLVEPSSLLFLAGHVKDTRGHDIAGVTITLSGSKSATMQTDSHGNYRFEGLEPGGSYTVTPSKQDYIFTPATLSFNNMTQDQIADFTGEPPSIQFVLADYVTNEVDNFKSIEVFRKGNIAGAASVDYATSDGTANQRTDYTPASGTLSFAPGELSKSFTVLIKNNEIDDGDRTVNLTLSNPSGAVLGTPAMAVLTILDDDPTPPNPIDDAQTFVRQQYADFLNRLPDAGGLDYWTNEITRCGSDAQCIHDRRVGVADAFFFEPEFQQTGAYIYRIYKAALGLKPTYVQFINDRGRVVAGPGLDQSKTDYALYFVQHDSFVSLYPRFQTADAFVDALLASIKQNSNVDLSSQRASLVALYDGTDDGRAAILRRVADTQAFIDGEYNRSFVLMEYFGYLRRDPDPGGYDFWLAQVNKFPLRDVGIQHAMACSFITSAEYQTRFSPVVTHTNRECPQ
jgi:photosystem II stability/assembly factor-like uncharacterized protein